MCATYALKAITLPLESESILATELQDLSQEYGLSSESETAVSRPSDGAGILNDSGPDIPVDFV